MFKKQKKSKKIQVNNHVQEQNDSTTSGIIRTILGLVLVAVVMFSVSFACRFIGVNADRLIFKQSTTYNEGVLDDLAKYKLEMIQSETEVEKKAIANMVVDRFANYDESKIESTDLRTFLQDCRNLSIENY